MKKIIFVCLGNICRSPLAHTIFEKLAQNSQLNVIIDSAGIGNWHQGEQADPRMRKIAYEKGYDITHRAKQLTKNDWKESNIIFSMGEDITSLLQERFKDSSNNKILYFRNFDPINPFENNVPDPYYGNKNDFDHVYHTIERTCQTLVHKLELKEYPFDQF